MSASNGQQIFPTQTVMGHNMKIKIREATYGEKLVKVHQKRQVEYPEIGEQLDAIMKWLATETEFTVPSELKGMAMRCMAEKSKHPKPGKKHD